tara:strand:+ start:55 stop:633 length:579 start_codon:yes stop_codon:yes gene_type:complete
MKKIMVLIIYFYGYAAGFTNPYETFLMFMQKSGSMKMSIEFSQIQYDKYFNTIGDFYLIRDQYYFFDDSTQRLIFKDNEISTISKINQQVIIDNIIPGDVNIFNILSGKNEVIRTQKATLENDNYKIPFSIPSWELSGFIRIFSTTGRPVDIKLLSGKDKEMMIKINSVESWDKNTLPKIDLTNYEKIDLRE